MLDNKDFSDQPITEQHEEIKEFPKEVELDSSGRKRRYDTLDKLNTALDWSNDFEEENTTSAASSRLSPPSPSSFASTSTSPFFSTPLSENSTSSFSSLNLSKIHLESQDSSEKLLSNRSTQSSTTPSPTVASQTSNSQPSTLDINELLNDLPIKFIGAERTGIDTNDKPIFTRKDFSRNELFNNKQHICIVKKDAFKNFIKAISHILNPTLFPEVQNVIVTDNNNRDHNLISFLKKTRAFQTICRDIQDQPTHLKSIATKCGDYLKERCPTFTTDSLDKLDWNQNQITATHVTAFFKPAPKEQVTAAMFSAVRPPLENMTPNMLNKTTTAVSTVNNAAKKSKQPAKLKTIPQIKNQGSMTGFLVSQRNSNVMIIDK